MSNRCLSCCSFCCYCCCQLISLGFAAFWIWFWVYTPNPICSIDKFDAFALGKATDSTAKTNNDTIHYDLKLKNRVVNKGIYYDSLKLSFYYDSRLIGAAAHAAFYQGHHKTAHRGGSFNPAPGVISENATNGSAVFRVKLATAVRYKGFFMFFKTKRRHLVLAADLQVNDQGSLENGIRLTSGVATMKGDGLNGCLVGVLSIFALIHFL